MPKAAKSGRLSLAPLSLEQALCGAMKIDPKKIPGSPMPKRKARKKATKKRR